MQAMLHMLSAATQPKRISTLGENTNSMGGENLSYRPLHTPPFPPPPTPQENSPPCLELELGRRRGVREGRSLWQAYLEDAQVMVDAL